MGGAQGRSHSQSFGGSPYHVRHGEHHLNPHQQHGRSRSGNFRILPPTSPGPVRSPTDISLAHLVLNEDNGEGSSHVVPHDDDNGLQLHIEDATNPPPGYASPPMPSSESGRRDSTDSEDNTPLIRVINRNRGDSAATVVPANRAPEQQQQQQPAHPPVPSYSDAVSQGAGGQTPARSPSPDYDTDSSVSDGSYDSD